MPIIIGDFFSVLNIMNKTFTQAISSSDMDAGGGAVLEFYDGDSC